MTVLRGSINKEMGTLKKGMEMAVRQSPRWHCLYPAPRILALSLVGPLGMVTIQKN